MDANAISSVIFKWFHVIAGIMWIGLLYFFNFVNGHVAATYDSESKKKVVPELMPRTLYWFRWGAAWTWFTGIALMLIVFWMKGGINTFGAPETDLDGEVIVNKFQHMSYLLPFIMVFVYDFFYKSNVIKNVRIQTIISYLGILGVLLFFHCIAGMEYRGYNIHIGAMFGSMMAFNVWFRIWPAQQRIITAIKNGDAPNGDDAAVAGLRSKHNTYMSVPLVWLMLNEHTHYVAIPVHNFIKKFCTSSEADYSWVLLMIVIAVGWHIVFQLYKKAAKIKGF